MGKMYRLELDGYDKEGSRILILESTDLYAIHQKIQFDKMIRAHEIIRDHPDFIAEGPKVPLDKIQVVRHFAYIITEIDDITNQKLRAYETDWLKLYKIPSPKNAL